MRGLIFYQKRTVTEIRHRSLSFTYERGLHSVSLLAVNVCCCGQQSNTGHSRQNHNSVIAGLGYFVQRSILRTATSADAVDEVVTQSGNHNTITARVNLLHTISQHTEILATALALIQSTQAGFGTGGILLDFQTYQVSGQQTVIASVFGFIGIIGNYGRSGNIVGILSAAIGTYAKDVVMIASCLGNDSLGLAANGADVLIQAFLIAGGLLQNLVQDKVMAQCGGNNSFTLQSTASNTYRVGLAIFGTSGLNGNLAVLMVQHGRGFNNQLTAGINDLSYANLGAGSFASNGYQYRIAITLAGIDTAFVLTGGLNGSIFLCAANGTYAVLEYVLAGCRNDFLGNQDFAANRANLTSGQAVLTAVCSMTKDDLLLMAGCRDGLIDNQSAGVNDFLYTVFGAGSAGLNSNRDGLTIADKGIQAAFVLCIGNDNFLVAATLANAVLEVVAQSIQSLDSQDVLTDITGYSGITGSGTGSGYGNILILVTAFFAANGALAVLAPVVLTGTSGLLCTTNGALAVLEYVVTGLSGDDLQSVVALSTTLSNIATFYTVGVDLLSCCVLALSTALIAETGSPVPLMLAVLFLFVAALGAFAVDHSMLAGYGLEGDYMAAFSTNGGLVGIGIIALAVVDLGSSMLTVNAALIALAAGPIPLVFALGFRCFSATNGTNTVLEGMATGLNQNGVRIGMTTSGALLGDVTAIGAVRMVFLQFGVGAQDSAQLTLAGCPVPDMFALFLGFFIAALGAGAVNVVVLAGLNSLHIH